MTSVNSSLIKAIGFENGEMRLEFNNGKTYSYTGPKVQEHYDALRAAPSVGKHFLTHVKRCPHTLCAAVAPIATTRSGLIAASSRSYQGRHALISAVVGFWCRMN